MNTLQSSQKIFLILFLVMMGISLFLPFYASTSDGLFYSRFSVLSAYEESGHYFSVYNGFNSVFGMFNLFCAAIIILLAFLAPAKIKVLAIVLVSVFILSSTLVVIQLFSSGYFLSPPDKLLQGFYGLTTGEALIMLVLFTHNKQSGKKSENQLLDDFN